MAVLNPPVASKPVETPVARFKRIGNNRIERALYTIGLIGQMTGTQYEKTPEQVNTIEKLLQDAAKGAVSNLRLGRGSAKSRAEYV